MDKRFLFLCICLPIWLASPSLFAQNTMPFRTMVYNLLHYPSSTTVSDARYNDFGAIVHYLQPDIIGVNELFDSGDARGADSLLIKGLNTNGINYYQRAEMLTPNGDLNNMLFYNSQKFTLYSHVEINTIYRNLDYYVLYLNDPNLPCSGDTVFVDVAVGHLKASTGTTNAASRATMAQDMMNFINARPSDRNILYMGDCNFYYTDSTTEPAYDIFTNSNNAMPMIDVLGSWTRDNAAFVNYFTQSTRGSFNPYIGNNGGATGGLDDRFDFVFMNNNVKNGLQNVDYVEGSYHPVGNDGQHYNKSIIETPANTDVPADIAQHLFNMSDHYPVIANFVATLPNSTLANASVSPNSTTQICSGNPATLIATATLNANEQIAWYDSLNSSNPIYIGDTFTTPILTDSQTFYCEVRDSITHCSSPNRTSASVTVNPLPNTAELSPNSITQICSDSTATLIATTATNEQLMWYDSPNSGSPIYIGDTFTTPNLTTTTTYYAIANNTSTNCQSVNPLTVTVVVNPPLSITISGNNTVCGTNTMTYVASPNTLATYNWTVSNGIILSGQGTSQVTVRWNNNNTPATVSVIGN